MKAKFSNLNEREEPSLEMLERAVSAIVQSGVLGKSKRRERLLQYLVKEEASGNGEVLKAFSIATDVFERDASFEPSSDSIVRSEVGRLRDALKLFYAQNNENDYVKIEIPKGSYRPKFTAPSIGVVSQPKRNAFFVSFFLMLLVSAILVTTDIFHKDAQNSDRIISISELPYEALRVSVEPFRAKGINADTKKLAFGMSSELVMDLSAYPWISVVSPAEDAKTTIDSQPDYVLTGSILWNNDELASNAQLLALPNREVVWSKTYSVSATAFSVEQAIIDLSREIATVIGSIHGIAPQLAKSRSAQTSLRGLEALLCYLGLHDYLLRPTDTSHLEMRNCLLKTVLEFPKYGDAWAALAVIHMDEERFERNPRSDSEAWVDAANALQKALIFAPTRMPSLNAATTYAIEAPDRSIDDFEHYSRLLLELYPRHPPTLFNIGSRMAQFGGKWEEGLELVDEALKLEPNPPSFYFITKAYHSNLFGTDNEAWLSAEKLTTSTSKSELLLKFIAASRNGFEDEMQEIARLLSETGLDSKDRMLDHVRGRGYDLELEVVLLQRLEKAFQNFQLNKN